MSNVEPLYTKEDLASEAFLLAHDKNIPLERATYFCRFKRGREYVSLARGLEPFLEVMFAEEESEGSSGPSVLFGAICYELAKRGLEASIEALLGVPAK